MKRDTYTRGVRGEAEQPVKFLEGASPLLFLLPREVEGETHRRDRRPNPTDPRKLLR
jgi:hypothetical protein